MDLASKTHTIIYLTLDRKSLFLINGTCLHVVKILNSVTSVTFRCCELLLTNVAKSTSFGKYSTGYVYPFEQAVEIAFRQNDFPWQCQESKEKISFFGKWFQNEKCLLNSGERIHKIITFI